MLEIQQNNPDEFHVCVKDIVLRFFIFEFTFLTCFKDTENIEYFKYLNFSSSTLMEKYFLKLTNGVIKLRLINASR